jgi:hypothetical protein
MIMLLPLRWSSNGLIANNYANITAVLALN